MKRLMSGNQAIARGAYEGGVRVATGYPGTPSSEILEHAVEFKQIKAQWAPNEKVALEVGAGASMAGARTLVTMKHVGINVAADPLMTLAYTGVGAGLVLLSADDPGMHSSQNEQDNRYYAQLAQIPLLEPADSQEAKDFVIWALKISEEFDTPVLLRTTTRISHSKGLVTLQERTEPDRVPYVKDMAKYVMLPSNARKRREILVERAQKLMEYASTCPLNRIEWGDRKVGVITSGVAYQYVKEIAPEISILKLGFSYPLPVRLIQEFAAEVERLLVVEELEPFLENNIKALGINCPGKEYFPRTGELNPQLVRKGLQAAGVLERPSPTEEEEVSELVFPLRPPVMCPSCPHRGVFYVLSKLKLNVTGDIGCYTLGALPPLQAMDSCLCMGASVSMAYGMELADPALRGKTVAVIGDSTFLHSGLTGLMNIVYNQGTSTIIVLNNSTTAMTGMQEHPGTGKTLQGEPTHSVDLQKIAEGLGIGRYRNVDPYDLTQLEEVIREEVLALEPSLIVTTRPCALNVKFRNTALTVSREKCKGCKVCLRLSCPAISFEDGKALIDPVLCTGCGVCQQVCKFAAIIRPQERGE